MEPDFDIRLQVELLSVEHKSTVLKAAYSIRDTLDDNNFRSQPVVELFLKLEHGGCAEDFDHIHLTFY